MTTFAFIPVRLSSIRLPAKALLKINNKPCIQYLIERVKGIKGLDGIVLCTTKNSVDDKIEKLAKDLNVYVFRGSEMDVLERFKDAALEFGIENIINIDGDDIFCESKFIELTIEELKKPDVDFVSWKNLPLGTTPIGIKVSSLVKICNQKNTENTETGWGKFFTDTGLCNVKYCTYDDPELIDPDIRLTLDYPEDFKLFKQIMKNVKEPFRLRDIIKFLRDRKDIRDLNKKIKDAYWENFEKKATNLKMK